MPPLDAKSALLSALAAVTLFFVIVLARRTLRRAPGEPVAPNAALLGTGFVTNFFDTLGIGSFAPTTAIVRRWKLFPDELLPGTLNIGHAIPTIAEAFVFTRLVKVDSTTLMLFILAAVVGSWIGAGVVARWPRRTVQLGMGLALAGAAILMLLTVLKLVPLGGELLKLDGLRLGIGLVGNFILGALMTMGIGLYGPCMILVYLLGMSPLAAFPIMMGSCAFLMPVAGARFIAADRFDLRAVLGLTLGGLPAVLIAAYLVKSLPLDAVRVLVVIVVIYTAYGLLTAARREAAEPAEAAIRN